MDLDDSIPTRATLLQRLKSWQDHSSWQEFFDIYWKLIYNVARKGGLTEAESQDVVQETMISVAKHMPGFKYDPEIGTFKTWLLNVTRWRIADHIRSRRAGNPAISLSADCHAGEGDRLLEEILDPSSDALNLVWDAEWEKNLLAASITKLKRRLDPQKFQIFDFCVNKEWKAGKVAETFGVSVDQVYMIKHRVTEMIKEEVKRLENEMT
jgi:RNA polymerase sigma factor (sigma-70 family)